MTATKVCYGPSHPTPATLPLDARHWYFRKSGRLAGRPLTHCRQCVNWDRNVDKHAPVGRVPTESVRSYAEELLARCGSFSRVQTAYDISHTTMRQIVSGLFETTNLHTAQRILAALAEQRRIDRRDGGSARFREMMRSIAERTERVERRQGLA
jgi:hypothetical protein